MNYEMRSGAGETIPQATVKHGDCGDDPSLRVAVVPTIYLREVDAGTGNACWVVCAKGDPGALAFQPA